MSVFRRNPRHTFPNHRLHIMLRSFYMDGCTAFMHYIVQCWAVSGRALALRHQTLRDAMTYSQWLESLIELTAKSGLEIAVKVRGKRLQLIRNQFIKRWQREEKLLSRPAHRRTSRCLPRTSTRKLLCRRVASFRSRNRKQSSFITLVMLSPLL